MGRDERSVACVDAAGGAADAGASAAEAGTGMVPAVVCPPEKPYFRETRHRRPLRPRRFLDVQTMGLLRRQRMPFGQQSPPRSESDRLGL